MIERILNLSSPDLDNLRNRTAFKRGRLFIKFVDEWVDVSSYFKSAGTRNDFDLDGNARANRFSIVVVNYANEWTKTQFWDEYNPETGKFNGTIAQRYLEKDLPFYLSASLLQDAGTFIEVPLVSGHITDIKDNGRTATLECYDVLYQSTRNKTKETLVYVDKTPDYIIRDLLTRAEYNSSVMDLQEMSTPITKVIRDDVTFLAAVNEVAAGAGGKITATPDGRIVFRTRLEDFTEPETAATILSDDLGSPQLSTSETINTVTVKADGYQKKALGKIFSSNEELKISEGNRYPETGTLTLTFENEINVNISPRISIEYDGENIGEKVLLGNEESDGSLVVDSLDIYENRAEVVFRNSGTGNIYIESLEMYGEAVVKISENDYTLENTTGDPDRSKEISSFYTEKTKLETVAKIIREDQGKRVKAVMSPDFFFADVIAGNLIVFSAPEKGIESGVFIVASIHHQISERDWRSQITLMEFRDLDYMVSAGTAHENINHSGQHNERITQSENDSTDGHTVGYWSDSLIDITGLVTPVGQDEIELPENVKQIIELNNELAENQASIEILRDIDLPALSDELDSLQSDLSSLEFADIGGTIVETQITDGVISTPKLAANSVEAAKIAAGAVITEKIGAGAVTTEKLYAAAVTAEKIAAGAITTEKLNAGVVTAEKIGANAITANKILAGTITTNELASALALKAGQTIEVGSLIKMGYNIFPTGDVGEKDGILIGSEAGNYIKFNGSDFEVKANLKVAQDDNSIEFVDSGFKLEDGGILDGTVFLYVKKPSNIFSDNVFEIMSHEVASNDNWSNKEMRLVNYYSRYQRAILSLGSVLTDSVSSPTCESYLKSDMEWYNGASHYSKNLSIDFLLNSEKNDLYLAINKPIQFPIPYFSSKPITEPDSAIFMWDYGHASQCKIAHKISDGRWIYYYAMKPVSYSNL